MVKENRSVREKTEGEKETEEERGRENSKGRDDRGNRSSEGGGRRQKNWRVRFVAPINFECIYTAVGRISSLLVMIKKNYKQKIPRMVSLFRGSARQAERLRKALTVPDLALSLPAKPTTLYLKIGALSRKLSLQREGANRLHRVY